MLSLLLSLIALLPVPTIHAQTIQPVPVERVERSERSRAATAPAQAPRPAAASAVVAPATKATAPAPAPKPANAAPAPAQKTPAPAPAPAGSFVEEVESEIARLVGAERAKQGLGALAADAKLGAIARAHSKDMLSKNYFSHTDAEGCGSSCRLEKAGYAWRAVGENIYTMSGYRLSAAETAQKMVDGWMKSGGHRANILKTAFTHQGVGVAVSGSTIYATHVFAQPK